MAIYVKAFVFVLFVYAISALPLNEGQQEDPQVDLFSVESVPEQDSEAASSNDNEELTRAKRQGYGFGGFGGYGGGFGGYGGYGGYPYGGGYGGYYPRHHHDHGGYGGYGGFYG